MRKKVDLTDLLGYEENPIIIIKGVELEVNRDAYNVFQFNLADDEPEILIDIVFTEESVDKIKKMHLNFDDMAILLRKGIDLMLGRDDDEAPQETASTT